MARPTKTLSALMDDFVRVRVTDMRGVDLSRYSFDYDLTFAVLTMDAGGHVYHRYGGRDERGADTWLSPASLEAALAATLTEHETSRPRLAPELPAPRRIDGVPSFARRDKGECIHCHSVNTSLYEEARDAERVTPDWIWKHPTPGRIGLDLDRDDQRRVTAIAAESPAAGAGLRVGDRLVEVGATRIATASDLMHALDRAASAGGELALSYERDGELLLGALSLEEGWKRGTPREFAWRPTKWALTPAPGFGGPRLDAKTLAEIGLPAEAFAFRVQYLVTWGDNRRYGQAAARAGLREGDVVVSVAGKRDFESVEHFHAWWRLEVEVGQVVEIETLRGKSRRTIELEAVR